MSTATVVGIATLLLGPALVTALLTFDRVVMGEYERHREEWERDGRPIGFFWTPPESGAWAGGWARQRLSATLLFTTPAWMAKDAAALAALRWNRTSVAIWCVGVAALTLLYVGGR